MTEKDVMLRVLYNPKTKEVYTNPEGNVYDFDFFSELETASKDFPDIKNAIDNGYIVKEVTENGIEDTLSYAETFCCCDRCGKLFLQNDLSFTDEGAPYCSECYKLYETYDKPFTRYGVEVVSRGDYESMPCPMYAGEFSDSKMKKLAKLIYETIYQLSGYPRHTINSYLKGEIEDDYLNKLYWKEMEEIAVQMGMRYYEDMSEEEYNNLCK